MIKQTWLWQFHISRQAPCSRTDFVAAGHNLEATLRVAEDTAELGAVALCCGDLWSRVKERHDHDMEWISYHDYYLLIYLLIESYWFIYYWFSFSFIHLCKRVWKKSHIKSYRDRNRERERSPFFIFFCWFTDFLGCSPPRTWNVSVAWWTRAGSTSGYSQNWAWADNSFAWTIDDLASDIAIYCNIDRTVMISPKQAFELYDVGIDCNHDYICF